MKLKIARFAALTALALSLTSTLAAQSKVGVVDFQQALLATADMQKQATALEAKFKPRQEEMDTLARELQEIQGKLQTASGAEAAQLQNEGARKQREAQRLGEDLQSEVDFERDSILQGGAARMREVLEALRAERGLELLVDVSSVISFDSALDLTSAATAAYDAKHPAN